MSLVRIYTASSTSPIVSLYGDAGDHEMILRYLDGWYSTPDAKVKLTERASGDGAHDVAESDIIYGTRTITAEYRILSDSRSRLLAHEMELLSLAHQNVRFRVTDDTSDLYAVGYVDSVVKDKSQQNIPKQTENGTLTVVCPRPERLAWSPLQTQLFPVSTVQGGLRYNGGKGLKYPLSYGTAGTSSNVALLLNQGSSKAYPVLTVTGPFPNGVQIQWGGSALQYDGAVGAVPLILDSRSQTASMGGVDVSRNLSLRDFPTVPAAGSVSLRLMSAGTGWVTAVCRDTYI
jgi:hypothetical protein